MERNPKRILIIAAAALAALSLAFYAYLQSREYLRGPVIAVDEPADGSLSTTSIVALKGSARNVSFLTLNDRQIFTDERGRFTESLLLQDGYNIMLLEAKDRFGHIAQKKLELVHKPEKNHESLILNP